MGVLLRSDVTKVREVSFSFGYRQLTTQMVSDLPLTAAFESTAAPCFSAVEFGLRFWPLLSFNVTLEFSLPI